MANKAKHGDSFSVATPKLRMLAALNGSFGTRTCHYHEMIVRLFMADRCLSPFIKRSDTVGELVAQS